MAEYLGSFDPAYINITTNHHRPGRDKYLCANAFEALPFIYGVKGEFLVDFYTYFRWFDDLADSPATPLDQRHKFIRRQQSLIACGGLDKPLLPIEEFFQALPFGALAPELKLGVLSQFTTLAKTFQEDVEHTGLLPRTYAEIRNYKPSGAYALCTSCVFSAKWPPNRNY